MDLELYRGQYTINSPLDSPPGFATLDLPGASIRHSPALASTRVLDADGCPWAILGSALETESGSSPVEQVRTTHTAEVPSRYMTWGGRWVLVGNGGVHSDFCGSLAVYFDERSVASTPALLRPGQMPGVEIAFSDRVNWFPPPMTGFDGVHRLLPSQVLGIEGLQVRSRPLTREDGDLSYADIIDRLEAILLNVVRQVDGDRLLVALTGGTDSRVVLAAAHKAGLDVVAYTQETANLSHADQTLPPLLAEACGVPHLFVPRPRRLRRPQDVALYDTQVAGHVRDADRLFFGHGQFDFLRQGDVLLRGIGFEVGRAYLFEHLPDTIDNVHDYVSWLRSGDRRDEGLAQWAAWIEAHPQPMDWRDRAFRELRVAGWAGINESGLDLLPVRRLNPAIVGAYASTALQIPLELRRHAQHHVDLLERMAPRLLSWPINPAGPRWTRRRIQVSLKRRIRRLRSARPVLRP